MPYQVQKPYVIVNGQKLVSPLATPQRMPFCDRCNELAATNANVYTQRPGKWWKWFSYPQFSCQPEALMGCEKHPVTPEIRFLDGRAEPFIRFPLTRWERLKEWPAVILAVVFALIFALILKLFNL